MPISFKGRDILGHNRIGAGLAQWHGCIQIPQRGVLDVGSSRMTVCYPLTVLKAPQHRRSSGDGLVAMGCLVPKTGDANSSSPTGCPSTRWWWDFLWPQITSGQEPGDD
jgi:hypothetical protein